MHAVIIANGELEAGGRLRDLWLEADLRVAADGGARRAREQWGLAPQVVIGDLDSLDRETQAWLEENGAEFIRHPVAKDETDLELALNLAAARGAERITILGALGGRVDQAFANVLLLARSLGVVLAGAESELYAAKERATISGRVGDTVSLLPLTASVEGIVTQGLVYPLRDETLTRGSTRGISNELTESRAEVYWKKGVLLVVHLFDEAGR